MLDKLVFLREIEKIEACFPRYKAWDESDRRKHKLYRDGLWHALKDFSNLTMMKLTQEAICGDFGEFMPPVATFYRRAVEIERESKAPPPVHRNHHPRAPHECSPEKPQPC